MSCPTCDHTMERVGPVGLSIRTFHCPRCGTVKEERDGGDDAVHVPKLVERCRKFRETLGPSWGELWKRLGVAESINTPENRS